MCRVKRVSFVISLFVCFLVSFGPNTASGQCAFESLQSAMPLSTSSDGMLEGFGAELKMDGDLLAVGGYWADDFTGVVLVFRRDPVTGEWKEEDRLTAADADPGDLFGEVVAVWSGGVIVVGARGDEEAAHDAGAAYVFRYDPGTGTWAQEAKLMASDAEASEFFGSPAISYPYLAVGARSKNDVGFNAGGAYVFVYDTVTSTWVEEDVLVGSDTAAGDGFGNPIDIHGTTIVVGAAGNDALGDKAGSAYIFRRNPVTSTWDEEKILTAEDATPGDEFGWSAAIGDDLVVVTAVSDDGAGLDAGSVYVFRYDPLTSGWTQETELTGTDTAAGDDFGEYVALSGTRLVVTALWNDAAIENGGAAYLFRYDEGTSTWVQEAQLVAADAPSDAEFGRSAAIDGDQVAVGAALDHSPSDGALYIFSPVGADCFQIFQAWLAPDGFAGSDCFGRVLLVRSLYLEEISVDGDMGPRAFGAVSLSFTCAPDSLAFTSILPGAELQPLNEGAGPDFVGVDLCGSNATIGVVFSLFDALTLEADTPIEIAVVQIEAPVPLDPTTADGMEVEVFGATDACSASVPVENSVVVAGDAIPVEFVSFSTTVTRLPAFIRGDVNQNGSVNLVDVLRILGHLFQGASDPPCVDAADANDDGTENISDPIYVLVAMFLGGAPPPSPYPSPSFDATEDSLGCAMPPDCD